MELLDAFLAVLFTALLYPAQGDLANACPCGFVGADCSIKGSAHYVKDEWWEDDSIVTHLNGTCNSHGSWACLSSYGEAYCACKIGYDGEYCEIITRHALLGSLILGGILLPLAGGAGALAMLHNHDLRTGYSDWHFDASCAVQGKGSIFLILLFRASMLAGCLATLAIQYQQVDKGVAWLFRFYTIWSFHLLTLFFLVGTALSLRALITNSKESRLAGWAEKMFLIIYEIMLPAVFLIAIMVWLVFVPFLVAAGQGDRAEEELFSVMSIIQHGINVIAMIVEFMLNGFDMKRKHWVFLFVYSVCFGFSHTVVMLVDYSEGRAHDPSYYPLLSAESYLFPLLMIVLGAGIVSIYFLVFLIAKKLKLSTESKHVRSIKESAVDRDPDSAEDLSGSEDARVLGLDETPAMRGATSLTQS